MKRMIAMILAAAMLLCLAGCKSETNPDTQPSSVPQETNAPADMEKIYEALAEKMPEMIRMDETTMLNFCGIQAADCVQVVAAICADGLITDEVWLIEAKDEAALERLKTLAENRLQAKGEDSITYSPEQNVIVKKSVVETVGRYVYFICSPDVEAMTDIVRTALGQ